jgi:hypothetical protein
VIDLGGEDRSDVMHDDAEWRCGELQGNALSGPFAL